MTHTPTLWRAVALWLIVTLALPAAATTRGLETLAVVRALPIPTERIWWQSQSGFALHGFDPFAYHVEGKAAAGSSAYEATWSGVAWRFASLANRDAFLAAPDVYAPRFGGYDATAMAEGRVVEADPAFFFILNGRLYLFRSADHRDRFLRDPSTIVSAAERAWVAVGATLVGR